MRVALTGASGIIGRYAARALCLAGHHVTPLDRAHGWTLGQPAPLQGHDALIHCAFAHAPGRYRTDHATHFHRAQRFVHTNLDEDRRMRRD